MIWLLALWLTAAEVTCPQCNHTWTPEITQDADVTAPEWVVIFDVPSDPRAHQSNGPWANLRVVIRADREGQAILKATRYLQLLLDGQAFDRMKFVEAQAKAPVEGKK